MANDNSVQPTTATFKLTSMDVRLTVRRRLPDNHRAYAFIGRVTAEWARLEHTLDLVVWELSGLPADVGSCLTGTLIGWRPRMKMIMALLKKRSKPEATINAAKEVRKSIQELADLRNEYVHNAWFVEEDDQGGSSLGQLKSYTFSNALGFKPVTEMTVKITAGKIQDVISECHRLRELIAREPDPSGETPQAKPAEAPAGTPRPGKNRSGRG